jgi:GT2 family glycosyltransferase
MGMSEKVSIIISTYSMERKDYVLDCINSIKNQTLLPDEILLILDPLDDLISFYQKIIPDDVKIVKSNDFGLSKARNTGITIAEGEILVFIDDDAVAEKSWLNNLISNFSSKKIFAVGGLIRPLWEKNKPYWFPEELLWTIGCCYKGLPTKKSKIRNPIGCNMAFRKIVFDKVGFFKEKIGRLGKVLLAGEEAEFSLRIIEKLSEDAIIYDPSAIVYHNVPRSRAKLRYVLRRSFYEGVSKAIITKMESNTKLSTESSYIKYFLTKSIP